VEKTLFAVFVYMVFLTHVNMELDLQSLFGLIYEGAIGQPRQTTSLCDPLLLKIFKTTYLSDIERQHGPMLVDRSL